MMKRSREEKEGKGETYATNILCLPEVCLAHAISFTTPLDVCRSSVVSTAFLRAANSDTVWECFLPADISSILSRGDDPVDSSSKKELFLTLAQEPILLDNGKRSFWLDKTSGTKCYMLSARSLSISWDNNPLYWRWIYLPGSRFEEVVELVTVCWLDVTAWIDYRDLSPNTTYTAYLIFNLTHEAHGLDSPSQEASITVGDHVATKHIVSLYPRTPESQSLETVRYPRTRDDDWMEVEMGEFYNDRGDDGKVAIRLLEIIELQWKRGLILEGIEIRPKLGL